MPSTGTKFTVGLFVISGLVMVIVFVLWLGMAQYFKEGRRYEVYFDESVQGLNKDSAVKYQGVGIGRVESISVAPDGKLVGILLNLDDPLKESDKMVAQLKSVGITGIMFIELTRKKEGEIIKQHKLSFEPKYPVIASKSSEIRQLLTDINEIIDRLKQIDLKNISNLIVETLDNANQTIKDTEIKKVSKNFQEVLDKSRDFMDSEELTETLKNIHQASMNLNQLIDATGKTLSYFDQTMQHHNQNLTTILQEVQSASQKSNTMIQNGNGLIQDSRFHLSNIDREILKALKNLETTSKNMNRLIQQVNDQPSLLLFSEPPAQKSIE
jgi:phospholipid/cholesterol/gamma-HCH transport system substrate-binding protein